MGRDRAPSGRMTAGGLGLGGAGVTEKQCRPPPFPRWAASWAVWAPLPCSAPCRLGHRKPHLPRPRCRPCLAPTFGRGRQFSGGAGERLQWAPGQAGVAHGPCTRHRHHDLCFAWGGGGGVLGEGGSVLWLGPGASKVHHQVRNRGGSGSIDRGGILSVLWFQGDRECLHQVGPRDFPLLGGEEAGWGHCP